MISRRNFCAGLVSAPALAAAPGAVGEFPAGDYTPFGYLDNPHHSWNLHRSGVLRSLAGIGFAFYYPAGPGGYFDFKTNGVYEAHLRLGFVIGGRRFWAPEDFTAGELRSTYHSKNAFTYEVAHQDARVRATFLQVDEDALAAQVESDGPVEMIAAHVYQLGGASWWGRDGLAGEYDRDEDAVRVRSFAAGPVCTLAAGGSSRGRFLGKSGLEEWMKSPHNVDSGLSYHPDPLQAGLLYEVNGALTVVLARGANAGLSMRTARAAISSAGGELARKRADDGVFWSGAPYLEGDWPQHWRNGWVYDFETLRMMVRQPLGVYRHAWDAMQIQAPRNVLAETSIDMWALSFADPETAKNVFLGQFLDAPSDNVPCMRENGEMNMVAADGSECGTSISWCFPYFCAASLWERTRDRHWLAQLYPRLARLLRWTLAHRRDSGGFLVGKCSWETGMDASRRFLIQQPTGGELTEFVRVVELQAAAVQAATILERFATILGEDAQEWAPVRRAFLARTQQLWKDDWFYDYDSRSGQPITSVGKDIGQAAPIFCGAATPEQVRRMLPTLRKAFAESKAGEHRADQDWQDGLHWSSLVFPFLESLWTVGDLATLAEVVHAISDRVYRSTDRRSLQGPSPHQLGWPGVSCEIWGAGGAYGGEGYGWGAVLPAHIIRNIAGFREAAEPGRIWLAPNLPEPLVAAGKRYTIRALRFTGGRLDLSLRVREAGRVEVKCAWPGGVRVIKVEDESGHAVPLAVQGAHVTLDAMNHKKYLVHLGGV